MFRTCPLSIIMSLNNVYTAIGICRTGYAYCLLVRSGPSWPHQHTVNITSMPYTFCCVYSVETHDDGQQIRPKRVEFFIKINLRNSVSRWLLLQDYKTVFFIFWPFVCYTVLWGSGGTAVLIFNLTEVSSWEGEVQITIYRVSQEECARLWESVPQVKLYRYNPKHMSKVERLRR